MSTSRESVALKKCNPSKANFSNNQNHLRLRCSSSLASATTDELSDKIIQPALSTPTLKIEAEEVSLIKIPAAKKPHRDPDKIDYSKLKPASKKKRTDGNCESLFIEDSSEIRLTRPILPKTGNSRVTKARPKAKMTTDLRTNHDCFTDIKTLIQKRRSLNTPQELEELFSTLRTKLHQAELHLSVSTAIILDSKLLEDGGLQVVIDSAPNVFPFDIKDDCDMLYRKWSSKNIDPDLYRGIDRNKVSTDGKTTTSPKFMKDYPFRISCNYAGQDKLVNGQWWPGQICAMRDGAHGEIQGGIHGLLGNGAFSVLISGGAYDDIDNGYNVEYCGTAGNNGNPSRTTKLMRESQTSGNLVGLLRSASSIKSGVYRPAEGIRYDGLYQVVAGILLDAEKAMYRFSLQRCPGQGPIRYQGVEARPTSEQVEALQSYRARH